MSILDEDPDEEFNKIIFGLELEEPEGAIDYTQLEDVPLSENYDQVRRRLFEIGELHAMNPVGEAADLHSMLAAIQTEMTRRWKPTK